MILFDIETGSYVLERYPDRILDMKNAPEVIFITMNCDGEVESVPSGGPRIMLREEASTVVDKMVLMLDSGEKIVTWNGTKFDWPLMARLSGKVDACRYLAKNSYDPQYEIVIRLGHFVGAETIINTMGLGSKNMDGVSNSDIPTLFKKGETDSISKYAIHESGVIMEMINKFSEEGLFYWKTKRGKTRSCLIDMLKVSECMKMDQRYSPLVERSVIDCWL